MDDPATLEHTRSDAMENLTPAIFEADELKKVQMSDKKAASTGAKKDVSKNEYRDVTESGKDAVAAKHRKRTKTGCLSESSQSRFVRILANMRQHAANVASNVAKRGRPAAIVSNPRGTVRVILPESFSRTPCMPIGLRWELRMETAISIRPCQPKALAEDHSHAFHPAPLTKLYLPPWRPDPHLLPFSMRQA